MQVNAAAAEDHALGPESARYILVEYGDLRCPDTALAEPDVQEALEKMDGQLRLVFRHFPLPDLHPQAFLAAEATEAAGAQNRFWEMRQLLLDSQDRPLTRDVLLEYARGLRLDGRAFARDLENHVYAPRVEQDIHAGARDEVKATPTFVLNGVVLDPGLDIFEVLQSLEEQDEDDEDDEGDEY